VTAVKPYERVVYVYSIPLTSYCCSERDQSAAPPHTPTPTTLNTLHPTTTPCRPSLFADGVSTLLAIPTSVTIIYFRTTYIYIYIYENNHVSADAANPSFSSSSDYECHIMTHYCGGYIVNFELGNRVPRVRRLMTRLWRVIMSLTVRGRTMCTRHYNILSQVRTVQTFWLIFLRIIKHLAHTFLHDYPYVETIII